MFTQTLTPYTTFIDETENSSLHSQEVEDISISEIINKPVTLEPEPEPEPEPEEEEEEEEEEDEEEEEEEKEEE